MGIILPDEVYGDIEEMRPPVVFRADGLCGRGDHGRDPATVGSADGWIDLHAQRGMFWACWRLSLHLHAGAWPSNASAALV